MKREIIIASKRILLFTALLFLSALLFGFLLPDKFPFYGLSTVYYLTLAVLLLRFFYEKTIGGGFLRAMLLHIVIFMLMWFMLQGAKYHFFWENDNARRWIWYMYYIPQIFTPLMMLYAALSIDKPEEKKINPWWHCLTPIAVIMILTVLTNDYHQKVFAFESGFANWDTSYSYGPVAYLIFAFIYLVYIVTYVTMIIKCRISYSKKLSWVVMTPLLMGAVLMFLSASGKLVIGGNNALHTTEIFCYMLSSFLCTCLSIGLIPSNDNHEDVLNCSSLDIAILDSNQNAVYTSQGNKNVSPKSKNNEGSNNCYTAVEKEFKFRNGTAIWKEDITELTKVNEELNLAYEKLAEESELIKLENELKEKNAQIKVRTQLYDSIATKTAETTGKIQMLASSKERNRENNAKYICFLGAYLKRYANLVLLNENEKYISVNELGLAIKESLKYLNYMGIPCDLVINLDKEINIDGETIIGAYELFEAITEYSIGDLVSLYAGINSNYADNNDRIFLKLNLEGSNIPIDMIRDKSNGIHEISVDYEDGISYIRIMLWKEHSCNSEITPIE